MSAESNKPPALNELLWTLANLIFRREAVMLAASIVFLVAAGAGGVVWAQSTIDGGVKAKLAPIEERQDKVEQDVRQVRHQMANVERLTVETNANVRLIAERLRLVTISLDPSDTGHQ